MYNIVQTMHRFIQRATLTSRLNSAWGWRRCCAMALFLSIFTLWPWHAASAAEVVHRDAIPLQKTDWLAALNAPQFDPAQGVLVSVELQFTGRLKGSVRYESLDAQAGAVTLTMFGQLGLRRPDDTLITESTPQTVRTVAVTEFDGGIDYAGTSGGVFEGLVAVEVAESVLLTAPADLALFTGLGEIVLPVDAQATTRGEGAGNLALQYTTLAAASLQVKYVYQSNAQPGIDLEKLTNGEDADEPTGPLVKVGDPVTWTYIIRNTGATPLVEITLLDDQEGAILTCPRTDLGIGESMTCTLTGVAEVGQYANVGFVTGKTPFDPMQPQQSVTDNDPSHYFGTAVEVCPVDIDGRLALPTVQYLGQGRGTYTLPTDFDTFIVKRFHPFRFEVQAGDDNGAGQRTFTSRRSNPDSLERVWACKGDCQFVSHLGELVPVGFLAPGITIGAVVIDDDNDERINSWVVNGDVNNPYQLINNQLMVENLLLDIPFEADWGFNAVDSVGLVAMCVAPGSVVQSATIAGNGSELAQNDFPTDAAATQTLFLPLIDR